MSASAPPRPPSLIEGSIPKALFFFTLPVMFGNVLQSINVSVNAIWIGRFLGEDALAASSNASSLIFFLIGAVFGVSLATTILVGQSVGAKNIDQAKRTIGTSAVFFTIASVGIGAAGYFVSPAILHWMKTPEGALPYALAYLPILMLGVPFIYLYNFISMALRGAGDSKTPFYFSFLSVGLDIGLNPLFIFGWGPIHGMGIAGAAVATCIANAVSLFAIVIYIYRTKHFLRIQRHELHYLTIDPVILRALIVKGVPMGLQLIVLSSSMIAMMRFVNRFGTQTTAAYGACLQLWNYIQMPAFAVGQAVSSMAAQNVGAKLWDRVHKVAKSGVAFNFLLSGALIILVLIFDSHTLGIFLKDDGAIGIGRHANLIAVWSFAFFGVSFVLSGVVRSTGAVLPPLLFLVIAMYFVRIPVAWLGSDKWGVDAVWWSFPISSLVSMMLSMSYYRFGGWKQAHMLRETAAKPAPVAAPVAAPDEGTPA